MLRMTVTFIDPESKPETEKARWVTADIDGLAIANVGLEVEGRSAWKPARYELTQLSQQMDQALKSGASLNVETRAHLAESKARIDSMLEASVTVAPR